MGRWGQGTIHRPVAIQWYRANLISRPYSGTTRSTIRRTRVRNAAEMDETELFNLLAEFSEQTSEQARERMAKSIDFGGRELDL